MLKSSHRWNGTIVSRIRSGTRLSVGRRHVPVRRVWTWDKIRLRIKSILWVGDRDTVGFVVNWLRICLGLGQCSTPSFFENLSNYWVVGMSIRRTLARIVERVGT